MRRRAAAVALLLAVAACSGDDAAPSEAVGATDTTAGRPEPTFSSESPPPAVRPSGGSDDLACWGASPDGTTAGIAFENVTDSFGLVGPLIGMHAHAAAWGDVDGDLFPDLVVGTFATSRGDVYQTRGAEGPSPDRLLLAGPNGFEVARAFPEAYGRTSGAVFVDLDNDGDDDLVMSRNVNGRTADEAVTVVLENTGGAFEGRATVLSPEIGGRSVGVLDVDEDGLLDLLVVEDHYRGGSSALYRNLGELAFEDATDRLFIGNVDGLGIATGDLNGDRHTDVFIAGSNRLFVGTGSGLSEVDGSVFAWRPFGNEDDVAGAAIADVNRDGRLDLVVGHHYNSTLSQGQQVPVRLYLNRTDDVGAAPIFEDVTDASGLAGLPTKAPHVELADFDNDGWPDVLTSASADNGTGPAIFRHSGLDGDVPRFEAPSGLGAAQYWVAAPTADVDRDGTLDLLLVEWEPALPSLLLRNISASGHWLEVSVGPELGGGVGTRVDVYEAGRASDADALVGAREIVASLGYTAGVERTAHFGLGDLEEVDVVVVPPFPHEPMVLTLAANQHVRLPGGCD